MTQQARSLSQETIDFATDTHSGLSIPNKWLTITHQNSKAFPIKDCTSDQFAKSSSSSITLVLMPPSSAMSKRSASPYGTYSMPSSLETRRDFNETPFTLATPKPVSHVSNSNSAFPDNLESFPVVVAAASNNTSPPLGILKTCYATADACVKATHSCSGHGACQLLHKGDDKTGADKQVYDCYGCKCKATVTFHEGKGMEESKKTTYWGGPACQKKDVSVPFWLLAGTTVLLVFLITSGMGLMYSMGAEELPSVIGAGVSGPSRK
jgi:hypothetical protein